MKTANMLDGILSLHTTNFIEIIAATLFNTILHFLYYS